MTALLDRLVAARWVVALLVADAWALRSLLGFADPAFYHPVNAIDFAAVYLYSMALALQPLSLALLYALSGRRRSVGILAAILTVAAVLTAIANVLEDGFGLKGFGLVYVLGAAPFFYGQAVLAVLLASRAPRELALVPLGLFLGTFAFERGGGLLVVIAWVAVLVIGRRSERAAAAAAAEAEAASAAAVSGPRLS